MSGAGRGIWLGLSLTLISLTGCSSGASERVLPQPEETQRVEVGRTYHFVVSTHCGVRFINLDGSRWKADKPLVENGTAPAGWGLGGQRGLAQRRLSR